MRIMMTRRQILTGAVMAGLPLARRRILVAQARPSGVTLSGTPYTPSDYPIQPKPFSEVRTNDTFWQPKIKTNAEVTIPFEIQKCAETGRPINHNVLMAAIYSLQIHPDSTLQAQVEARIQDIRKAEDAKPRNGNDLFEVAAAHFTATGKRDLLDPAIKSANVLYEIHKTQKPPFSGGERDAINCLQLYRVTNDKRFLDLAKHYLDIRGLENSVNRSRHNQSHMPVLDQREAVGHAVNCASLMVSLAEVGALTGIRDYADAAVRMWQDVVGAKMYVTGGIGSTGNEGFGPPYALPNISAYSETCAALMFTTFNHKLFLATGDGQYIDVMERSMYNNNVDGVSASGDHFFYVNRLASAGDGRDHRWQRASLECCPPNLVRFMASMPGYIYAQHTNGEIYVNLYVSSDTSFKVNGKGISLSVQSDMPWGGRSTLKVSVREPARGAINLRIPGWARNQPAPGSLYSYLDPVDRPTRISVNGARVSGAVNSLGYVSLDRTWKNGDVVEMEFPVDVRRVVANDKVRADRGRMAVERGPIVYCAEWPDYPGGDVLEALVDPKSELKPSVDRAFYGGVTVLHGEARSITNPSAAPKAITLIPYYLWANRGAGPMSVWLSTAEYAIGDTGPAGGLIFYVNPNAANDGWRYLEAAPFDQSAGASWGCFRTEIPGARGTAIGTGKQNTKDMLFACTTPGTAAHLCATYSLNGVGDWFLPSMDELTQMYLNLTATGACDFRDRGIADNLNYWSSSQATADMARHVDFADNARRGHYDDKDFPRRVRAVRAF
jgi:uncharacterized protein